MPPIPAIGTVAALGKEGSKRPLPTPQRSHQMHCHSGPLAVERDLMVYTADHTQIAKKHRKSICLFKWLDFTILWKWWRLVSK